MDNNAPAPTVTTPEASLPPSIPPPAGPQAHSGQQWLQKLTANNGGGGNGIFSQLADNPLFGAGFALGALGVVTRYGVKAITSTAALLRRRLLISVEVTGNDKAFHPLLNWMMAHQQSQFLGETTQTTGVLSILLRRLVPGSHEMQARTIQDQLPNGQSLTRFTLVPGPGRHILHYRNTFLSVHRSREGTIPSASTSEPFETITMTTLYSQRHIFRAIFSEAQALSERSSEGKTTIYAPAMTDWKPFGAPKRKRPLASVVLENGVKERIVEDIASFLAPDTRAWYLDRGIPYRRGYLLWGPPGTGKSSFIEALAGHLDFNIAMLHLSERGMTDDRLYVLLHAVPPRTLVLLEDADAAFVNRRQADADGYQGATVTFSGLLNALDGVVSAEERIIFLTTNHVERMDAAVVRPGRVDMTVRFGEADEGQVREMWRRFYGEAEPKARLEKDEQKQKQVQEGKSAGEQDAEQDFRAPTGLEEQFMRRLTVLGMLGRVSTAQLQGLFVLCKDKPEEAIARIEGLSADMRVAQRAVMK